MELVLFDDERARSFQPFALTRPVGELRFGAFTLRERAERFARARCAGHLAGSRLAGFRAPGAAPGLPDAAATSPGRPRLFLCSRTVPATGARFGPSTGAGLVTVAGQPAGWWSPTGEAPAPEFLRNPDGGTGAAPVVAAHEGKLLDRVWHLVTDMPDQLVEDFDSVRPDRAGDLPPGVHLLGDAARLSIAPDASIEPGVVLDVRGGPIRIDHGSEVRAFSRIAGPAWIGPDATLLGGTYDTISIGPVCRVHGEVEATTFAGWSNKAHDGFLGHAYVGSWVNLGALTNNSDLKNDYGTVRLITPGGETDTGVTKLGCLLGDHVKTGIGLMLNTGTIVGAGSNLFGAAQPPRYVPPFSWGSGSDLVEYRLDRFLAVAARVMARRQVELDDGMRAVLEAAWHESRRS